MSTASTPALKRYNRKVFFWVGSLFTVKPEQFHLGLGLIITAIVVIALLILRAVGHQELWLRSFPD